MHQNTSHTCTSCPPALPLKGISDSTHSPIFHSYIIFPTPFPSLLSEARRRSLLSHINQLYEKQHSKTKLRTPHLPRNVYKLPTFTRVKATPSPSTPTSRSAAHNYTRPRPTPCGQYFLSNTPLPAFSLMSDRSHRNFYRNQSSASHAALATVRNRYYRYRNQNRRSRFCLLSFSLPSSEARQTDRPNQRLVMPAHISAKNAQNNFSPSRSHERPLPTSPHSFTVT